ncbi:MAG: FAD:protein FMN transferase [Acidimicrobiales bacterium]
MATGLHHVEHVMGMAVSIDVRDRLPAAALTEVIDWLHHVDATFSPYRPDSPVSRFGSGEIGLDDLDVEVLGVLALCEELHADTGGAFDVLAVPAPNGSRFDPSGLVKGWSIERAVEVLERHGARNLCLNAGGDIAVRGEPEPGRPWRIGIRDPEHSGEVMAVVAIRGRGAVATSATYERGAHIIDPATGEPTTMVASVTIVGPDLTYVDAHATAVFVMGVDGLQWLADRHRDHDGLVVTHDRQRFATAGFGSRMGAAEA